MNKEKTCIKKTSTKEQNIKVAKLDTKPFPNLDNLPYWRINENPSSIHEFWSDAFFWKIIYWCSLNLSYGIISFFMTLRETNSWGLICLPI